MSRPAKVPPVARAPGEAVNPVPALLADRTLQRGDIVVFPEGPKIFAGPPGSQHALADFAPLDGAASRPGGGKPGSKLVPAENDAWRTGAVGSARQGDASP